MKNLHVGHLFVGFALFGAAACAGVDEGEIVATESALTTTYQAENASDIDEGVVESIHAGFTGTGYVNINNFSNTFFLHIINAPFAGPATLRVRYANGTSSNRPIAISVNGAPGGTVPGAPTGSWSTWATASVPITLAAGNNDVVHSSVVAEGMPNIDKFDIIQSVTRTFQAEAANDIDEGEVESIHPGFTGTGYVNINNFSNTFFLHIIDSPVAATVNLRVRYANGTTTNRPIRITGNGGGGTVPGTPTGSWSTWATATVQISLVAGNNDVVHSSVVDAGMPNIDKFDITW
jgi:exo-1,4-beta-D-glucosaminidase